MRKLKKLTLKKEVIDRLEDNLMNRLVGGANFCPNGNPWTSCEKDHNCPNSYGSPPKTSYDCPPDTSAYDCPNTCGAVYTCNG